MFHKSLLYVCLEYFKRDFKKNDQFEQNACGLSLEKTKIDEIIDYLRGKEEQQKEFEEIPGKGRKIRPQ